jgi:uncharacterized protein
MSKEYLPTAVDAYRFAENGVHLHGTMSVQAMSRLVPTMISPDGDVEVDVQFGIDEKIRFIKGWVKAHLNVQCQRCLELFAFEIISDFVFVIVRTDADAKKLPQRFDPVMIKNDSLNISDMVEEELIINLPLVPMHAEADCKVKLPIVVMEDPQGATLAKKANPFKVIESLKIKPK